MKATIAILFCVWTVPLAMAHPGHDGHPVIQIAAAGDTVPGGAIVSPVSKSAISITTEGDIRVIRANGLPDHSTGRFPNRGNPNRISPQDYTFHVPLNPVAADKPAPLGLHPFGVAVNGVVFDPGAAEWWRDDPDSGWRYEAMSGAIDLGVDRNNAHVQPNGAYHYHAIPVGLMNRLSGGQPNVVMLGWAADGFPIYGQWGYSDPANTNSEIKKVKSSYRVKSGTRPGGPGGKYDGTFVADYEYEKGVGDLDECNGRFGVTEEFSQGTYYYVLTDSFPFIPRMFKGTPDRSFLRHGPGPNPPPRNRRPPPPPNEDPLLRR